LGTSSPPPHPQQILRLGLGGPMEKYFLDSAGKGFGTNMTYLQCLVRKPKRKRRQHRLWMILSVGINLSDDVDLIRLYSDQWPLHLLLSSRIL